MNASIFHLEEKALAPDSVVRLLEVDKNRCCVVLLLETIKDLLGEPEELVFCSTTGSKPSLIL